LFLCSMHALCSYRRDTLRRVTLSFRAWEAQDKGEPGRGGHCATKSLTTVAAYMLLALLAAKQLRK